MTQENPRIFLCPGGEEHDGWILYGEDCFSLASELNLSPECIVGPYPHYELHYRKFTRALRLGAMMRGRDHYRECVTEFGKLLRKGAKQPLR